MFYQWDLTNFQPRTISLINNSNSIFDQITEGVACTGPTTDSLTVLISEIKILSYVLDLIFNAKVNTHSFMKYSLVLSRQQIKKDTLKRLPSAK